MIDKIVLVIDDDLLVQKILAKMLNSAGQSKVLVAPDGFAALDIITKRGHDIGLILCDLKMPAMDGVEFIRHLADLNSDIPLAIMTGTEARLVDSVANLTVRRGINFQGALSKPINRFDLASLVKKHITVNKKMREPSNVAFLNKKAQDVTVSMLSRAIVQDEIICYLQPQVDAKTLEVVGYEALARWQHPKLGLIMPDRFISLAEDNLLIDQLTFDIFRKGLGSFTKIKHHHSQATISFNLSANSLNNTDLPEILCELLAEQGVMTSEVVIEITESKLSLDLVNSLDVMSRLSLKGFKLSIDDFGTGFSSLEQLQKFPFTELKIDRVFTQNINNNPTSQMLVESSVDLAVKMGLNVVAEGVETSEHIEQLRLIGCDVLQGFYFSQGLDEKALVKWLDKRNNVSL